jgi:hypothetical protein
MKTATDLTIETFVLTNSGDICMEYFFTGDKEFASVEIPAILFNAWITVHHFEFKNRFVYEGEVQWVDMFYYDIPKDIKVGFILHWEKCKAENEKEAA